MYIRVHQCTSVTVVWDECIDLINNLFLLLSFPGNLFPPSVRTSEIHNTSKK